MIFARCFDVLYLYLQRVQWQGVTNSVMTQALSNVDNSVQYLRSIWGVKGRVRTGWHAQAAVEFDAPRVFPSAHPDNVFCVRWCCP